MKWSSLDAYQSILSELPGSRRKVFRHLMKQGPLTGRELNQHMNSQSAHKRLSELQRQGLIVDAGTRTCRVTGHESHAWNVIGEGPLLEVVAQGGVSSLPKAVQPTRSALETRIRELEKALSLVTAERDSLRLQIRVPPTGRSGDQEARQMVLMGTEPVQTWMRNHE